MELGGLREEIMNMGRRYIERADAQSLLQQVPNNIFFTANGREGTIKAYFVGNELTSFDMHVGISSRKVQNVIDFR